jgi:tRNA dimethylallyltransferase
MSFKFPFPGSEAALVLTGATASGKSALALRIAETCAAEIIALDSMTLYRRMDIGTAKPSPADRRLVAHHLIDVLDPAEEASVAWWLERALAAAADIAARGKRALFVGGTGLYLKALLFGLFEGPGADPAVRRRLEAEASAPGGLDSLWRRLQEVDPTAASRLHANDLRRVVRALEVWEATGRPLSSWQTEWKEEGGPASPLPVFWLDPPRADLHRRINRRTLEMLARGWLDEARSLLELRPPPGPTASQAVGYRELFEHLRGERTLAEATERIQARTRQFAKRQVTWFRHLPGCVPVRGRVHWPAWNLDLEIPQD